MAAAENEVGAVGSLPLTESQKGLLVIDGMSEARHLYNLTFEIHLTAAVDSDEVRAALEGAVAVQPALHTDFSSWPSPCAALRDPDTSDGFPFETAALDGPAAVSEASSRLGATRFDLKTGPLYRFCLLHSAESAVLIFAVHHLVFDYFSLQPFLNDFAWMLNGRPTDQEITDRRARRVEIMARELAVQRRIAEDRATLDEAEEIAARLRDATATTIYPLPGRPAETSFTGTRVEWEADESETSVISATCKRYGLTPYEFFMAVYGSALARHSANVDVTIGTPFFTRRTAGALDLAGFYVNTLPLVLRCEWSQPFADYAISVVKPAIAHARSRSHVAFNQLVEVARPERLTSRNPIFSCMLALYDDLMLPQSVASVRIHGNHTAKFDLWLGVTSVGARWRFELEYDIELIPAGVAQALANSVRAAVRRAAEDSSTLLADLFTDASITESRATDGIPFDVPDGSLAEWMARTAAAEADRTAIEDSGSCLSYEELQTRVERAAAGLRRLGVRPGDVVALQLEGLVPIVVAMLAVMRVRAAYLPLDAAEPPERTAYMVGRSGCRLVIGECAVASVRSVPLTELTGDPTTVESVPDDPEAATYVMFTSGSSGRAKGVHMPERVLRNLTAWQIAALALDSDSRFVQYAPLGFDVSFQEIVPTLCAGGTLIASPPGRRADFSALAQRVHDTRATHLYLPVAALRPFVQAVREQSLRLAELSHLCVSGEQLVVDEDIRLFFAAHPRCLLVNLYGPTETHAVITHRPAHPPSDWPAHVPIGHPFDGVLAYVVDTTGHLAPPGVQGELYLGGVCPALGYVNDPARTSRAFLFDRFAGTGTMYRTGDQVMRNEAGELVFLGRLDGQVKIRGYRVELGEVEFAARSVAEVHQAVAAVRDSGRDREVVLFVVAEESVREGLKEKLRAILPAYMLPARVYRVDAIPTTPNGKFDRARLMATAPESAEPAPDAAPEYRSDLERELAGIWAGLIGIATVERDKSLLEYGAHSILMFHGLQIMRKRYGVTVPVTELFGEPTVAALARRLALETARDRDAG